VKLSSVATAGQGMETMQTQDQIHRRLDSSQDAVEAALLIIYDRQTAEERAGAYTKIQNGVGFSKFDAEFCTSLVEQLKRGRKLTERQLPYARKKMKRYWRQLVTCMTTEVPDVLVDMPVQQNKPIEAVPGITTAWEAHEEAGTW
jgi:hypothetical protein